MSTSRRLRAAILSLIFVASCSSPYRRATPVSELAPSELTHTAPAADYRIGPGDELDIRFFHSPDLNLILPVRPDGRISLPYVRDVQAGGRTPSELEDELRERYAEELEDPVISVIVLTFQSTPVHVGGEVGDPGVVDLNAPLTVLDSIMAAGGLLPTGRPSEVLVIRRRQEAEPEVLKVNLRSVLTGRDTLQNIPLRPYDIVYVPSSPITEINRWVDQYIRLNIPINFTVRVQ